MRLYELQFTNIERFRRELRKVIKKGLWVKGHSVADLEIWEKEARKFLYRSLGEPYETSFVVRGPTVRRVPLTTGEAVEIIKVKLAFLKPLEQDVTESMLSPDF